MTIVHRPVLLDEVVEILAARPGGPPVPRFVDCTLGGAGHAEALLEAVPGAELLGLDRDPEAVQRCQERLSCFRDRVELCIGDYRELAQFIEKKNWTGQVGGLVADLGLSSFQLDDPQRGFSFRDDGPLDMRFDATSEIPTAADLLADLPEDALAQLFRRFGDEPHAKRIARGLVERRSVEPVTTTRQLAELVEQVRPRQRPRPGRGGGRGSRLHPATLVFQALRIAVNDELNGLRRFVRDAVDALAPGGRLTVISFHRGEDREIKNALRDLSGRCTCPPEFLRCECGRIKHVELLTKKPVEPSPQECAENPRARSARLRAAEKVA